MSRPRLQVSVLCLVLVLGASWSLAAAPPRTSTPVRAAMLAAPSDLLARLWSALASLWGQEGASLDPSGRSATRPTTNRWGQAGASLDPDGQSATRPITNRWGQAGATADPNGLSLRQPTTDAGCSADPDGRCL